MSLSAELVLAVFALSGAGALAALAVPERRNPLLLSIVGTVASLVLLAAGAAILLDDGFRLELWPLLSLGTLVLEADRLSGLFLFVAGLVFVPVSLYSARYLDRYRGEYRLRYFSLLYLLLLASIVLVPVAGDAVSFLSGWEAMSIAAYLLVAYESRRPESSHAAFVMLAMSEAGTIAVIVAFVIIGQAAGSFDFAAIAAAHPVLAPGLGWAAFLLSFFGFAVKAGLVPFGGWQPLAQPVAPANVSALLSAVVDNLGIYGIVRVDLILAPAAGGPGIVVLIVGSLSALIGILYATTQNDLKRLLAHSTIENMGIVAAGIGAAMIFRATGHPIVTGIALIAALYHLANHSTYKALLFIGAGAVETGAGTRDLDRLGGILHKMPWIGGLYLIGVLSIAALPPFNGFVSEWLTLQTVLRSVLLSASGTKIAFAIAGALLALTAGLAATCFAKVFAMGFLGLPRSPEAAAAAEARLGARLPLTLLALACIGLGLLPTYVIPVLDRAIQPITHQSAVAALVPPFFVPQLAGEALPPAFVADFRDIGAQVGQGVLPGRGLVVLTRGGAQNPVVFATSTSYMLPVLAGLLLIVFVAFRLLARGRSVRRKEVWAGAMRHLRPEFTYTATGFSNPVRVIFAAIMRPKRSADSTESIARHFRTAILREESERHVVDRFVLDPPVRVLSRLANLVRAMHRGEVNAYAAYVLAALVIVLVLGAALR